MKEILIMFSVGALTLCTARPAPATMTEYSTTNRAIAVTNTLPATEVRPLAAYILFPTASTGSVTLSRVTRGVAVPLARHDFSGVAALTWFPPADFPLRRGEAFAVSSTVARFTLQLETSSEGHAVDRTEAAEWYDAGRPYIYDSPPGVLAGGYDGDTNALAILSPQLTAETSARLGADAALSNSVAGVVRAVALNGTTNTPIAGVINLGTIGGASLAQSPLTNNLDAALHAINRASSIELTNFNGNVRLYGASLPLNLGSYLKIITASTTSDVHIAEHADGTPTTSGDIMRVLIRFDGAYVLTPFHLDVPTKWIAPPATSTDPGSNGDTAYDENYFYLYTNGRWIRSALAVW